MFENRETSGTDNSIRRTLGHPTKSSMTAYSLSCPCVRVLAQQWSRLQRPRLPRREGSDGQTPRAHSSVPDISNSLAANFPRNGRRVQCSEARVPLRRSWASGGKRKAGIVTIATLVAIASDIDRDDYRAMTRRPGGASNRTRAGVRSSSGVGRVNGMDWRVTFQ